MANDMSDLDVLPREIRQHIWSLLLPHFDEHGRPAFSTNIFRTCTAFGQEAKDTMLRHNQFVKIRYKGRDLHTTIRAFGVPFLSMKSTLVEKVSYYSLLMTIRAIRQNKEDELVKMQESLLLAKDLPILCLALENHLTTNLSMSEVNYGDAQSSMPRMKIFDEDWSSTAVVMRTKVANSNIRLARQQAIEQKMLQQFTHCISPHQQVVVHSNLPATTIDALQDRMSLRKVNTIWLNALAWSMLTAATKIKERIDGLFEARSYWEVITLASRVVYENFARSDIWNDDDLHSVPACQEIFVRLAVIYMDCVTTWFVAALRLYDQEQMLEATSCQIYVLGNFITDLPGAPSYGMHPFLINGWPSGYVNLHDQYWMLMIASRLTSEPTALQEEIGDLFHSIPRYLGPHNGEYLDHDIEALWKLEDEQVKMGKPDARLVHTFGLKHIVTKLSVSEGGCTPARFRTEWAYDFEVPNSINGWIDEAEEEHVRADARFDITWP